MRPPSANCPHPSSSHAAQTQVKPEWGEDQGAAARTKDQWHPHPMQSSCAMSIIPQRRRSLSNNPNNPNNSSSSTMTGVAETIINHNNTIHHHLCLHHHLLRLLKKRRNWASSGNISTPFSWESSSS